MGAIAGLITAEDLWNLPQDHLRHELIRGELTTKPLCGALHGQCAAILCVQLGRYSKMKGEGRWFAGGTGFHIHRNPDTVLAPDLAFVRSDRLPFQGVPKRYCPGAPDIVIEILEDSNSTNDVLERIDLWLDAGTKLAWVVDPEKKSVWISAPKRKRQKLRMDDEISGEDVLPGLRMAVADIFE